MLRFTLALLFVPAIAFAEVPAEMSGDAVMVEFAVRGSVHKHLRIKPGGTLTLSLTGPGQISLDLREEALAPRQEAFVLAQDGKPVAPQQLNTALDTSVRSEKGLAVSRPAAINIAVPAGRHELKLQWPVDAVGAALVAVGGASIAAPLPPLALLAAPPLPLPLPAPQPVAQRTPQPPATPPAATPPPSTRAVETARADVVPALAPLTAPPKLADDSLRKPGPIAGPGRSSAQSDFWQRFSLDIRGSADRSAETYTSPVALGRLGAQVAFRAMPLLPVMADFDLGFSRQEYQARQIAGDGRSLARTALDERRSDAVLAAGWDLGPWLRHDGRLQALPFLGAQYSAIRNGGFPLDLFGVAAGANARWSLSSALALQGGFRWAYNLLKGSTLSAVGTPVSDLLLQAGISLPLSGGYALDLGYRGDVLSLTYDTRVSHGMAVGVHSGF